MNETIVTPSPITVVRRFLVQAWDDPDSRSTLVGLLAVLLVHLLILLFAPNLLRLESAPSVLRPHSSTKTFNIQITPEMFAQQPTVPPPPTPKRFVETNPNAPENTPDHTNNFAAQNQQVAQPKPTPNGASERPAQEGKKDIESNQIVDGRLQKPAEPVRVAPAPETPPTPTTASPPRAEQNPLAGFDKREGDNPEGFGTNVAKQTDNMKPIPERIDGAKNVPLIEGATGLQPAIDPKHPRPRQSLVEFPQTRPAVLQQNDIGTSNIGVIAINAKFSEYGLYLHRLCEAVQIEWERVLSGQVYPPPGTYVVVKFVLNSHGNIVRFSGVENHSSQVGAQACTAAITNRAPYGEWTDDMKASLNPDGEELVFTFYYE